METGGAGEASPCSNQDSKSLPSKLRISGSWDGPLDVDLGVWTLLTLRQEIARRSNSSPDAIKMISGGKVLTDERGMTLIELGIKNNAKILALRVQLEEVKAFKAEESAAEDRTRRLSRIREALSSLEPRHFKEPLRNLRGLKVKMGADSDQSAIMMGWMLHRSAMCLIKQAKYKEALDILAMGEEAYSLCDPKIVEIVDNEAILQIDTVWCHFMLQDISYLSMAKVRLSKARKTFDLSYFKNPNFAHLPIEHQYLRRITYLRLVLLESVVAYHCGLFEESRKALTSAQAQFDKFLSDEELADQIDIRIEIRAAQKTLMSHGLTPTGKSINPKLMSILIDLGLAGEALRSAENDIQRALDDLTNAESNSKIQLSIESRDRTIAELVSMGFSTSKVVAALNRTASFDDALAILVSERSLDTQTARGASSSSSGSKGNNVSSADKKTKDMVTGAGVENKTIQGYSTDLFLDIDPEVMREGEAITEYKRLLEKIKLTKPFENLDYP